MSKFSPEEKAMRRRWLVLSMIVIWVWPLISLGFLIYEVTTQHLPFEAYSMYFWVYLAVTLLSAVIYVVLYRCAYLKPGVRFLISLMIVWPLLKVKAIADAVKTGHDYLSWISIVVNVGLFVWWYILSLKLIKMNKRIKGS